MAYGLADSLLFIQFKLHVLIDMVVEEIAGGIRVFVLVVTACFLSIIVLIWTLMIGAQNAELTPRRLCVGRHVARVCRSECFVLLFLFWRSLCYSASSTSIRHDLYFVFLFDLFYVLQFEEHKAIALDDISLAAFFVEVIAESNVFQIGLLRQDVQVSGRQLLLFEQLEDLAPYLGRFGQFSLLRAQERLVIRNG